jgi:hypothetical protein
VTSIGVILVSVSAITYTKADDAMLKKDMESMITSEANGVPKHIITKVISKFVTKTSNTKTKNYSC